MQRLLATALLAALLPAAPLGAAENLPPVEVFAPVPCLACIDWAEHLRQNGFSVTMKETADMAALKKRLKVPAAVESVHTARVAGYFIEGHVPAEDIKELLKEKPKARGLAVPGLPAGAPGREASNPSCERGLHGARFDAGAAGSAAGAVRHPAGGSQGPDPHLQPALGGARAGSGDGLTTATWGVLHSGPQHRPQGPV